MQYQIPQPHAPIDGALSQQTFPPPGVAAIQMARYTALQASRYQPAEIPITDGPSVQRTDPIPSTADIEYSRYKLLDFVRAIPGPVPQFAGARIEQTYIFPQPQAIRTMWPSPAQYPPIYEQVDGAPIQRTDPILPFGATILSLYPGRQFAKVLFDSFQPAATTATFEFKMPQPNLAWWPKPSQYPPAGDRFEGAAVQQTYEFILGQANRTLWPSPAQYPNVPRQTDGALSQRTDPLYPFGQTLRALYPGRLFPAVQAQLDQTTAVVQTDVFRVPNDVLGPRARQFTSIPQPLDGVVTTPQTYEFRLPQANRVVRVRPPFHAIHPVIGREAPEISPIPPVATIQMSRYSLLNMRRAIPGAIAQVNQGAANQQTNPIPGVALILMNRFTVPQVNRYRIRVPDIIGGFVPPIIIPAQGTVSLSERATFAVSVSTTAKFSSSVSSTANFSVTLDETG